jgi:hypothetical protein
MSVIFVAILALLLGRILLVPFERELKVNIAGLLGMSYVVGIGVYTFALYLFTLMGGKLTFISIALVAALLLIVVYFLSRKDPASRPRIPLQISDWTLLALVTPLFGGNLYLAWLTPIYWPDSIFFYDGIGRVIAIEGTINMPHLAGDLYFYGLNALSTQLMHAVTYILSTDRAAVLYSGFYIALVLIFHSFSSPFEQTLSDGQLGPFVRSLPRLILTLSVASTPFVFAMGYTVLNGLPAAVYLFSGILVWKRFVEFPSGRLAFLTGLMFGLCAWTRYDGVFFYCLVELLTLYIATYDKAVRRHVLLLVTVPAVMMGLRYVIVFMSGKSDRFAGSSPIPFLDLWLDLFVAALGALVYWVRPRWLRLLRRSAQWLGALAGIIIISSIALFSGLLRSLTQLGKLISDPIWGATLLLAVIAAFSWSLFRGFPRLLLVLVASFIVIRVVLYAGLGGQLKPSDVAITHSGNRILLYIWPLFLYWVSCSDVMPRLFSFCSWARKKSSPINGLRKA